MKSILSAAFVVLALTVAAAAQRAATVPAPRLPPLSMTCPMHPDVVESRPGSCPLCKMALTPVRLDTSWMCPLHTHVMGDGAGACRLCGRQMVQVRVALTWTCASQRGIERLEPGTCPDGTPMIVRKTLRPHGNHNPQHGGQFFMAPDNWHHLEGTYPRARTFRLYLYDDYARPLSAADMKRVRARVVTRETFDPATRKTTEHTAFPLRVAQDSAYLEARVDTATLPAEMTAKVRIKPDAPEYRFDFTFQALTNDPAAATPRAAAPRAVTASPRPTAGTPAPTPRAAAGLPSPANAPAGEQARQAALDPLAPLQIPETISGIVEQLEVRDSYIRELIRQGNFAAVWVPAFHAKDLAIALEPHLGHLAPPARERGEAALQQVVRFAWLLDAFGDVGNRQQLDAGYAEFTAALADVVRAFAGQP
jgi:hypothetical protein